MVYSQDELEQKLSYWQKRLRLQDWRIEVKLVRERELDSPEYAAQVGWCLPNKTATISILDPIDYPPEAGEQNMENDLVHELLHLHLAPIHEHYGKDCALYSMFEEQAIESIAFGLVDSTRDTREREG